MFTSSSSGITGSTLAVARVQRTIIDKQIGPQLVNTQVQNGTHAHGDDADMLLLLMMMMRMMMMRRMMVKSWHLGLTLSCQL